MDNLHDSLDPKRLNWAHDVRLAIENLDANSRAHTHRLDAALLKVEVLGAQSKAVAEAANVIETLKRTYAQKADANVVQSMAIKADAQRVKLDGAVEALDELARLVAKLARRAGYHDLADLAAGQEPEDSDEDDRDDDEDDLDDDVTDSRLRGRPTLCVNGVRYNIDGHDSKERQAEGKKIYAAGVDEGRRLAKVDSEARGAAGLTKGEVKEFSRGYDEGLAEGKRQSMNLIARAYDAMSDRSVKESVYGFGVSTSPAARACYTSALAALDAVLSKLPKAPVGLPGTIVRVNL